MPNQRPCVLSIAGFDPSAGAGILSDIKTFEYTGVYGLGVCSALTFQNDILFENINWISIDDIISQIEVLKKRFDFTAVKIGLIENLQCLDTLVDYLKSVNKNIKIIWDPILEASTGFKFHKEIDQKFLKKICSSIYLIIPNWIEVKKLTESDAALEGAEILSQYCNVYLKGGHSEEKTAKDILFSKNEKHLLEQERINTGSKHGSGCVLSSAITAGLAKGLPLVEACERAKIYVTEFLKSTDYLIGFHKVNEKIYV